MRPINPNPRQYLDAGGHDGQHRIAKRFAIMDISAECLFKGKGKHRRIIVNAGHLSASPKEFKKCLAKISPLEI